MAAAPDAAGSDQMKALVSSVKKNIGDILGLLDNMDKLLQQPQYQGHSGAAAVGTAPAVVKKLRNEVTKEEAAIDRALNPGQLAKDRSSKGFLPLKKSASMGKESSKGSEVTSRSFSEKVTTSSSSSSSNNNNNNINNSGKGSSLGTTSFSGIPSNSKEGEAVEKMPPPLPLPPAVKKVKGGSSKAAFMPTLSQKYR